MEEISRYGNSKITDVSADPVQDTVYYHSDPRQCLFRTIVNGETVFYEGIDKVFVGFKDNRRKTVEQVVAVPSVCYRFHGNIDLKIILGYIGIKK